MPLSDPDRIYTTRSSAHGSDYVPNPGPQGEVFNMTLEEAEADVKYWRSYADTVGGDAIIVKKLPEVGEELIHVP